MSELQSIIIPASVEILCKYCFVGCESLPSIIFESDSHLQRIEESAFSNSELQSIIVPEPVEILCKYCFAECQSLSSITFESDSNLQLIEDLAFSTGELQSIILQHSVEFIDGSAFCVLSLYSIAISAGESRFRVCDPVREDISSRSVVRCFGNCKSVVIASSIEILCKSCFERCELLSSIIFESDSHLQHIEESSFCMSGLQSIIIPASVEILCKYCFAECESLSSITFESNSHLQHIEESSFCMSDCNRLLFQHPLKYYANIVLLNANHFHQLYLNLILIFNILKN
jgi:hypothetical protein